MLIECALYLAPEIIEQPLNGGELIWAAPIIWCSMPMIVSNLSLPVSASPARCPMGVIKPNPRFATCLRAQHKRVYDPMRALRCDFDAAHPELHNRSWRHLESGAVKLKKQIEFRRVHRSTSNIGRRSISLS